MAWGTYDSNQSVNPGCEPNAAAESNSFTGQAMSQSEIVNSEIVLGLKQALKSRGVTYKHVAAHLKVSEKTIKRLFQDKDCTLSRLSEICAFIGLSIYDLFDFARHYREPLSSLTPEQESYLKDRPYHFSFLFFLTSGHCVADIQSQYELSDVGVFRYLRDLDQQGFIELGANNQFRLLIEGKPLMKLSGPLKHIMQARNEGFLTYVIKNDGNGRCDFNSAFRYMSPTTFDALQQDLLALSQKYRKLAEQNEQILPRDQLIPVKWTTLLSEYPICGEWPLVEPT